MHNILDIRPLLMIIINVLGIFILYSINDMISPFGLYIIAPVLFLLMPAVYLSFGKAMFVIIITALFGEAFLPIRGFSFVIIWLLGGLLLRSQRFRFRRVAFLEVFIVSAIVNSLIILAYGLCFISWSYDFLPYFSKLFVDAFFSVLFLVYTSRFVLSLHFSLFQILGLDLNFAKGDFDD